MKLLIAGTRSLNQEKAWLILITILKTIDRPEFVISGTVQGIDQLGEKWASLHNIPVLSFPADWNTHGKAAGPIRNKVMAKECDQAVILWDGISPGTRSMISELNKLNKPYVLRVIEYDQRI